MGVDALLGSVGSRLRALHKTVPVGAGAIDPEGAVALASDGDVESKGA